jgi:hypothetical protein
MSSQLEPIILIDGSDVGSSIFTVQDVGKITIFEQCCPSIVSVNPICGGKNSSR